MKTSAAGRKAISDREGVRLKAYQDSVGIWTVGVGHTAAAGPPAPKRGTTITAAECDDILSRDLAKFERAVTSAVKVPLTQSQFDALVSLAFNIGGGAFAKSTLVKRLNKGDLAGAADAFMSWNKAGGRVLAGLTTRRKAEREQFLSDGAVLAAAGSVDADEPDDAETTTDPGLSTFEITTIQARLLALNYKMVAKADGEWGPRTTSAISAFQKANGLTEDGIYGPETEARLYADDANPMPIAKERAEATAATLAPESGIIRDTNKLIVGGGGIAAGLPVVTGALDWWSTYSDKIKSLRDTLAELPALAWAIGAGLVVVGGLYYVFKIRTRRVEMHRVGETA
jgi:lysozyme